MLNSLFFLCVKICAKKISYFKKAVIYVVETCQGNN